MITVAACGWNLKKKKKAKFLGLLNKNFELKQMGEKKEDQLYQRAVFYFILTLVLVNEYSVAALWCMIGQFEG